MSFKSCAATVVEFKEQSTCTWGLDKFLKSSSIKSTSPPAFAISVVNEAKPMLIKILPTVFNTKDFIQVRCRVWIQKEEETTKKKDENKKRVKEEEECGGDHVNTTLRSTEPDFVVKTRTRDFNMHKVVLACKTTFYN
jgi:hypothetical protein